jgi:IS30 family transposase
MHVNHESIYKALFVPARKIIHHSFTQHLLRKRPLRHSRFHARSDDRGFININNGVYMHERTKNIDNRKSLGYW